MRVHKETRINNDHIISYNVTRYTYQLSIVALRITDGTTELLHFVIRNGYNETPGKPLNFYPSK